MDLVHLLQGGSQGVQVGGAETAVQVEFRIGELERSHELHPPPDAGEEYVHSREGWENYDDTRRNNRSAMRRP